MESRPWGQEKVYDERIDGNNILSSRNCGEFQSEHSKPSPESITEIVGVRAANRAPSISAASRATIYR